MKKRTPAQRAVIQGEGAVVYSEADFDAPQIDYLKPGESVVISKNPVRSKTGIGLFYMVKTRGGGFGYIADVDVIPGATKSRGQSAKPADESDGESDESPRRTRSLEPLFFSRYIGGIMGLVGYAENFSNQTFRSDTLMYGLKAVGPGVLIDGPPLDFNLLFSLSPPDYYSELSPSGASGMFLIGELAPIYPIMEGEDSLVYFGLGLMATYTRFKIQIRSTKIDSQELRLGLSLPLAFAYRFGDNVLRVEARYYYEKTQYLAYLASFQVPY